MDLFLDKVKGISNTANLPFHKVKAILENNRVYPDIIPFILLALLAKGSELLSGVPYLKPYLHYVTKHIQIPVKYVTLFQTAFVDSKIFFDLVYFYILISLAGLFLKLYQSLNRVGEMLITPLTTFTLSVVVAYTGLIFGLILKGGADPANWSRPVLVTVFGPLACCLAVNLVTYYLGEKRIGDRIKRVLPFGLQQWFDGVFLLFLSGSLLTYGRQVIDLLKGFSQ